MIPFNDAIKLILVYSSLGFVSANFRQIAVEVVKGKVVAKFCLDHENEEDRDAIEEIMTDFESSLLNYGTLLIECKIVVIPYPEPVAGSESDGLIFMRREKVW